jgi:uncharacterized protein YndB with AHSA1/START domain
MLKPAFNYISYIETTAEELWEALTNSEFTTRYALPLPALRRGLG